MVVSAAVPFRSLDRRIWVLAAARLVVTAGFSTVMPFLAMHLAIDRKVPAVVVGAIWTIAGACGAIMQWVAGSLSDRIGRRPLMIAATLARAVNLALLGWAIGRQASIATIGVLCVANSVLRSFFDPVANAAVADLSTPDQRVAAFSLQRVGINIGWSAGPAIAYLLASLPYDELFYWSVPLTLVAAIGVATLPETRRAAHQSELGVSDLLAFRGDRTFVLFLWATLAFFILQVQLYQTLSIYAAGHLGMSRAQVGTLYILNGALVVLLQFPAVHFIHRRGTSAALLLGSIGYALAYAACGLATGQASLLFCVAAITLAEIITSPAQQASVAAMAPAGRIGAYSGLYGLTQVVGQSAGPLIGTAVLDLLPDRFAWFVLALFGVLAARLYSRQARRGAA